MIQVAKKCQHLKTIISMDPPLEKHLEEAKSAGVKLLYMNDVEEDVPIFLD